MNRRKSELVFLGEFLEWPLSVGTTKINRNGSPKRKQKDIFDALKKYFCPQTSEMAITKMSFWISTQSKTFRNIDASPKYKYIKVTI